MKNWFTLFYHNGNKKFKLLPVDDRGNPTKEAMVEEVQGDLNFYRPGFSFEWRYVPEIRNWEKTRAPKAIHLYQASPSMLNTEQVDELVWRYFNKQFGETDLGLTSPTSVLPCRIQTANVQTFWSRIFQGEMT